MAVKRVPGCPLLVDGCQHRIARREDIIAAPGTAHRLGLVEEAGVAVHGGGPSRRLAPPAVLWLPPGWTGRATLAAGAFWYRLDVDPGPGGLEGIAPAGPVLLTGAAALPWRQEIVALSQRWWRADGERRICGVHALALLLRIAESQRPAAAPVDLVERFLALVRDHIGSHERVAALARRLGVGRTALDTTLRRRTGMTAAAWLRRERLRIAARMLEDGEGPTGHVARVCGYRHEDGFIAAFRAAFGATPAAWRRSAGSPRGSGPGLVPPRP